MLRGPLDICLLFGCRRDFVQHLTFHFRKKYDLHQKTPGNFTEAEVSEFLSHLFLTFEYANSSNLE